MISLHSELVQKLLRNNLGSSANKLITVMFPHGLGTNYKRVQNVGDEIPLKTFTWRMKI